ncbi:MAG TPA: glycosyltransferase family A protein [Verrucomicrobiota bacterium]|nr:glycosyltransferase family A protein [Verrucomicrobiota bacterium]HQL79560.1 glycosyltransferase family A protein [Verrucomicrobiota bacterium]
MPLVSLITPHFERPELLRETLGSVRASTFADWECLVVDDGSSAAVWDRVQAMADGARIRALRRESGLKGPSACRNLGLRQALGDYVMFLDADDLLAPWCLEQRLAAARAQPEAALWVFPVLLFTRTPGDSDQYWNTMDPARDDLERFLRSDGPWCVSSALWRREALRTIGGFNEAVCYGDDCHLHLRALLAGLQVRQFPQALPDVFIRRGAETRITNSPSYALVESRRVFLEEATRLLRGAAIRPEYFKLWEGRYFVEAEFLLFNVAGSRAAIDRVLAEWQRHFRPGPARRVVVRAYFRLALACRRRAYLALRIARRIAMRLLPPDYFPNRIPSRNAVAPADTMHEVRAKLAAWSVHFA